MMFSFAEPVIRMLWYALVGPVAVLFFVGRVDDAGNMARPGKNKPYITTVNPGAFVGCFPFGNMVLTGRQEERRYLNLFQVYGFTVNCHRIRLKQSVVQ